MLKLRRRKLTRKIRQQKMINRKYRQLRKKYKGHGIPGSDLKSGYIDTLTLIEELRMKNTTFYYLLQKKAIPFDRACKFGGTNYYKITKEMAKYILNRENPVLFFDYDK